MRAPSAAKGAEMLGHSYIAGRNVECAGILENSLAVPFKPKNGFTIGLSIWILGHSSQRHGELFSCKGLHTNSPSSFSHDKQ